MGKKPKGYGNGGWSRRKDGRFTVYLGRRLTTVKDEKAAEAKLKEWYAEEARGEIEVNQRTTVEKYMRNWLETYKKNTVKPTTYNSIMINFENQIVKYIGHLQLHSLKTDDIQKMLNGIYAEKSYSTMHTAYVYVNECLNEAVLKHHIRYNPCIGVKLPRKPTRTSDKEEKFFYTPEQVKAIVAEASALNDDGTPKYRYGQVILLLLATGMREGEAVYLKWKNVDIEKRQLRVCGNAARVKGGILEQDTPKTKKSNRVIPLNDNAINALLALKQSIGDDYRVIATQTGNILCPGYIHKTMSKIIDRCNIEGITETKDRVHALRHTFAATLIRSGTDIKVVSELLGHNNITITLDVYHHVIEEQKRDAISTIDNVF